MAVLITLDQAKAHLRIEDEEGDIIEDLILKMQHASDVILDYIEVVDSGWDETNVPLHIQTAVLMVLANLWEYRGDDIKENPLTDAVIHILRRTRTPVLA